jgi:hypothetical protein
MSTCTKTYRGIVILYGCEIATADFHAHFDLPVGKRKAEGLQRFIRPSGTSAPPLSGKAHVQGSSEQEVLALARAQIDSYLDNE